MRVVQVLKHVDWHDTEGNVESLKYVFWVNTETEYDDTFREIRNKYPYDHLPILEGYNTRAYKATLIMEDE